MMCSWILAGLGRLPTGQRAFCRLEYLDHEREAGSRIARVRGTTIPTRARRESGQQIDFGKELNEVTRPNRAGLHEVIDVCPW